MENEWNPAWHKADGTEIRFPKVNGRGWPQRLSEAIAQNKVKYLGLPSSRVASAKRSGSYTPNDVIRDITIAMAGGNVGGFVNATMAHSMVIGKHRPLQLCSLEDAIDKCINPDDANDVVAIDLEAKAMIREIIESGKPVDELFWTKRGLKRFLKFGEEIKTNHGKISQIAHLCNTYYNQYCNKIYEWSQENARPPQIIHDLGQRMYFRALPHARDFRMKLYNMNAAEHTVVAGGIERNSWENIYEWIVDKINEYERIQDKYDFVLGLYSVVIKVATSAGKITDQMVMNRAVYPYLELALQYYGVANISMYHVENNKMQIRTVRNTEWYWPDAEGKLVKYTDPLSFQKAHAVNSPIVWTMPKPDSKPGPSII